MFRKEVPPCITNSHTVYLQVAQDPTVLEEECLVTFLEALVVESYPNTPPNTLLVISFKSHI